MPSLEAKGFKAPVSLIINSRRFVIDSADDPIHSNDAVTINGGNYSIAIGDDAMHADLELTVNAGDIDIS